MPVSPRPRHLENFPAINIKMMKKSRRHALGQHFLTNPGVLKKIVQTIDPRSNDLIIEIGPGRGALTIPLAERAGRIIAIEKDKVLADRLKSEKIPNLNILEADVLKIDLKNILAVENTARDRVKLVGNLPYSISSPLLFRVMAQKSLFPECVFLLQKEVAERICASPGSKKYAPLSILFQIYFAVRLHFVVSGGSFSPPPQVESALVSLRRRPEPLFEIKNEERFQKFLRLAYAHRRKTLLKNLKELNLQPALLVDAYGMFRLSRLARAEELTISQFVALYNFLFKTESPTVA
jgi:16S rRNA (adenine1518-N6/adenine1519-N6)-dimethyltransferase